MNALVIIAAWLEEQTSKRFIRYFWPKYFMIIARSQKINALSKEQKTQLADLCKQSQSIIVMKTEQGDLINIFNGDRYELKYEDYPGSADDAATYTSISLEKYSQE